MNLSKSALFAGISESEYRAMLHCFETYERTYAAGETIGAFREKKRTVGILQIISQKTLLLSQRVEILSCRSIREKLLHYFALCSHRQASDTFSLPLSMSALAEYICADRSAMTREMSRLKKEGILSVQGRKITLHSSHE